MYFSEQMYARQGALSAKRAEQGRILIIEDSRSVSSLMRHRLEKDFFCQVTQCASADVFRDIIRRGDPFDVAVVDLNLPGASDGEVFGAIKRGIPSTMMAGYNGLLSDAEIWQVITYVRSRAATP